MEEALKKFPGVKITQSVDIKGDPRIACDTISTFIQSEDKPDGIICLESSGGHGSADALQRLGVSGKIPIRAFDRDPETLMSYYGLKFLNDLHHNAVHEFKDSKTAHDTWIWGPPRLPLTKWPPMPARVDTGTTIVDKNNLVAFGEALAARLRP